MINPFRIVAGWFEPSPEKIAARGAREAAAKQRRIDGALPRMSFDPKAPDATRLAAIKGLPQVLWPAAWEALDYIAATDPNPAVQAAARARREPTSHAGSGSSMADTYHDPMHPNSMLGPGPSFYKR